MTDEQLIDLAKQNGWEPMDTIVKLDHLPQFKRGNLRMWRNPSGVTVAELEYEGAVGRYTKHRYYKTLEEAVAGEGAPAPTVLDDL